MITLPSTEPGAPLTRFLVVFANGTPPQTLFTDEREIRIETLSTANVLASDSSEAIALATVATHDDDLRPLAALTVDDLKTMAEALERFSFTDNSFTDNYRVGYTLDGYATAEHLGCAASQREDAPVLKA